jgi:MFS family permease
VVNGGRLPFAYVGLVLTYLAVSVNLSVTSVALPTIATDLGASTSQLSLIFGVTPLFSGGLMLFAGAWGDRFGRRVLLVSGLSVFLVSAILSATATDVNLLILYRALTGVGAALAMPAALALTFDVVPEQSRRTAIGILGATQAGGALIGPIVAGVALTVWSWPAVFLTIVPFIVVALAASTRLPSGKAKTVTPMDTRGAALVSIASLAFIYMANELSAQNPQTVLSALAIGALSVLVLVFWERRAPHPLVDSSVLRERTFRVATLVVFGSQVVLGGFFFIIAQYLQLVLGYTPLVSGLMLIPTLAAWALVSSTASRTSALLGTRRVVIVGLVLASTGYALLAVQPISKSLGLLIGALFLIGMLGIGPALMTHSALSSYRSEQRTVGAAVNGATARFGFSFGIALLGGFLGVIYESSVQPATAGLTAADAASVSGSLAEALTVARTNADSVLAEQARQAFTNGYVTSLAVAAVLTLLMAIVVAVGSERVKNVGHRGA